VTTFRSRATVGWPSSPRRSGLRATTADGGQERILLRISIDELCAVRPLGDDAPASDLLASVHPDHSRRTRIPVAAARPHSLDDHHRRWRGNVIAPGRSALPRRGGRRLVAVVPKRSQDALGQHLAQSKMSDARPGHRYELRRRRPGGRPARPRVSTCDPLWPSMPIRVITPGLPYPAAVPARVVATDAPLGDVRCIRIGHGSFSSLGDAIRFTQSMADRPAGAGCTRARDGRGLDRRGRARR